MNVLELQSEITYYLDKVEKIIKEQMPDKGLKCEDAQKVCVLNALNKLYQNVAGITDLDLLPDNN